MENKYTIFVGGAEVADYYVNKETAKRIATIYQNIGYDDVVIVKI